MHSQVVGFSEQSVAMYIAYLGFFSVIAQVRLRIDFTIGLCNCSYI